MRESSTYQAIIAEGVEKGSTSEARRILLMLGSKRFGPASPDVQRQIEQQSGIERLEELTQRVLEASSWDDLLAAPEGDRA